MNTIKVPSEFILAPFFNQKDAIKIENEFNFIDGLNQHPLIFDLYEKLDVNALKPWENKYHYIPYLLQKWGETEPALIEMFEQRDRKKASAPMQEMITTFLTFLFWLNDRPVPWLSSVTKEINELNVKPVNATERIEFLLLNPNQYHAFIQLQQLFIELRKKYSVSKLKNNK